MFFKMISDDLTYYYLSNSKLFFTMTLLYSVFFKFKHGNDYEEPTTNRLPNFRYGWYALGWCGVLCTGL